MFRQVLRKRQLTALSANSLRPKVTALTTSQRGLFSLKDKRLIQSPATALATTNAKRSLSTWGRRDNDDLSPREIITEIRNRRDHAFTLKAISRGWADNTLPYDDIFLKEYIKAAVATNRLDSMDVTGLIADFRNNGINAQHGVAPSGAMFSAGASELNPLHVVNNPPKGYWTSYLLKIAITVSLFAGIYYYLNTEEKTGSATAGSGGGGIAGRLTGQMKSNLHVAENPDKSFKDVVGVDEAKSDLQEIVMYLKEPERFTRLGGKLPKGVLLTGPPGTGKTLLAKAIAGEAGVPFFYTSGSEFEEMFVGVGAKRVRDMFEAAKAKAPCIIFIDEIDAIGGSRHLKDQSTMKMTLNQLLVEMDGFETNNGVVVIAATNFPDSLDNALTRPGRLDKHVDVPLPDIGGRTAILKLYGSKVPLGRDVDMEQLSRGTPGFSGADLFNLVNQAALKSSIEGLRNISMASLEYAKDKIMMGAERQSAIITEETIKCTAYHEAGHAVVAHLTAGSEPIHKATVMPRGRSLGMVMQLPEGDQTSMTKRQMLARMDVCMGGRVAEELMFGPEDITSGASSDIQQATRLAHAMVTKYGMSDKVGMVYIEDKEGGKDVALEVKELLSSSYIRAKECLQNNHEQLEAVAKGLIEFESLSGSEIVDLINGKKISSAHHKRSQRPSRDIVPIKNRPRPNMINPPPPGAAGNSGGPPRRLIRKPLPGSAPANNSASVTVRPDGKVTWGNADAAGASGGNRGSSSGSNGGSLVTAQEADDSDDVANTASNGWGSSIKSWFGYSTNVETDLTPPAHNAAKEESKAVRTPGALPAGVNNNKRGDENADRQNTSDMRRPSRPLPSTVGPPVEKIPGARSTSSGTPLAKPSAALQSAAKPVPIEDIAKPDATPTTTVKPSVPAANNKTEPNSPSSNHSSSNTSGGDKKAQGSNIGDGAVADVKRKEP